MQIYRDDQGTTSPTDMANPPRPSGRPRHNVDGVKRRPLTLHTPDAFKDELIKAAKASGRSLTQKAEFHIRRSLDLDHDKDDRELVIEHVTRALRDLLMTLINPELAEILACERAMRDDRKGWIFPSPHADTAAGHRVRMNRPFEDAVIRAGLDPVLITPHVMRHTAITKLVKAGVDLPTIQRISGHKTLAMVLRYVSVHGKHIDQGIKAIGRGMPLPVKNRDDSATFAEHDYTGITHAAEQRALKRTKRTEIRGDFQRDIGWRPEAESNRCTRICSPLHSHSAIRPATNHIGVRCDEGQAWRPSWPRGATLAVAAARYPPYILGSLGSRRVMEWRALPSKTVS